MQAFLNADLFVFASNIEYSPLVLFESCAAGLPFITVPVGNAEEIVSWTGAGIVCNAKKDHLGYTRVNPSDLSKKIEYLLLNPALMAQLSKNGKKASIENFNWDVISRRYEKVFMGG